jgi:Flp pilus assembly protein TadG
MTAASAPEPSDPNRKRRRGFLRRKFLADQSGTSAVEFALVAVPFFALLMGMFQAFLIFFASQVLETVTMQASRQILTGQVQSAGMTQSQFAQLVCSEVKALFTCGNLMIDVQAYSAFSSANTGTPTLTYSAQGQVTNNWSYNPGTAGQIVVVRIMYVWPLFLGPLNSKLANLSNGNRLIMASAAFQNEP